MIEERDLRAMAERLVAVGGVVGVTLGGSRARGDHHADSDVDVGLYYRGRLDVAALGDLAREVAGPSAQVTSPGAWGPWVDGGGWLNVGGMAVDWIYRDLDRVHVSWADARAGVVDFRFQVGHPLGVPTVAYAGEVALARVLADPSGELGALHAAASSYPSALGTAVVAGLDEADFLLAGAAKVVKRADAGYVAGLLFRVVGLCAHALHARAGRWLVNEKGAIAAAGALPGAPEGFASRAHHLLGQVGTTPRELAASLDAATALVDQVRATCA